MMRWQTWCLASAAVLLVLQGKAVGQTKKVEPRPLSGPVLVLFDDRDGKLKVRQFGVFRDDKDAPRNQHIEESWMTLMLPGQTRPTGYMALLYNLVGADTFNGWFLQVGTADWSAYEQGEIVFLLRRLDPAKDRFKRSVNIGTPDTACTSNLKVELKARGENGAITSVGLRQFIGEEQDKEQEAKGFCELRVPLDDFGLSLKRVHELVLVFENNRLMPMERSGALGIRGIFLATKRGQKLEEIQAAKGK